MRSEKWEGFIKGTLLKIFASTAKAKAIQYGKGKKWGQKGRGEKKKEGKVKEKRKRENKKKVTTLLEPIHVNQLTDYFLMIRTQ